MTALLLAALLSAAGPAAAQAIDDSDLSGGKASPAAAGKLRAEGRRSGRALVFRLSAAPGAAAAFQPGKATGALLLADRAGMARPARAATAALVASDGKPLAAAPLGDDGRFALPLPPSGTGLRVRFALDNPRWSFKDPSDGGGYAWESAPFTADAAGVELGALSPEAGSENSKAGLIHLTYLDALDAVGRAGAPLDWWRRTLEIDWPDDADYFSPWSFSLHLTRAEAWDVILHELGHSVMHQAMDARAAGGSHKIDECYSPALAWSEGWASFFAAFVRLDAGDPDARFEFMVPRRAPIRIENVPEDVCRGQANEWRVTAALWDLYDLHADGEDLSELPFARLWRAWAGAEMGSLTDYFALLEPRLSPAELAAAKAALRQNTVEPGPAGESPRAKAASLLALPSFD